MTRRSTPNFGTILEVFRKDDWSQTELASKADLRKDQRVTDAARNLMAQAKHHSIYVKDLTSGKEMSAIPLEEVYLFIGMGISVGRGLKEEELTLEVRSALEESRNQERVPEGEVLRGSNLFPWYPETKVPPATKLKKTDNEERLERQVQWIQEIAQFISDNVRDIYTGLSVGDSSVSRPLADLPAQVAVREAMKFILEERMPRCLLKKELRVSKGTDKRES